MMFSIFKKRDRNVYSNRQLKELIADLKKGGRPALMGLGITEAQAAKIKEAIASAGEKYYRCVVVPHIGPT